MSVPDPVLAAHSREWERLRELVAKTRGPLGLSTLSEQELWELPSLYRKAISDLSLLRTRGGAPALQQELSHLCNSAQALIYRDQADSSRMRMSEYLLAELPRTVRRRSAYILAAAAIMTVLAVVGWFHAQLNPMLAESVLGPRLVAGIHTSLKAAREQADLGLAAQIEPAERSAAALAITLNNVGVAIRAFLFGILAGVLTVFIIAFNGYMLGVVAYLYMFTDPGIPINLPLYFIAGIAPHGSIELPAICIAGGAGMILGFSWIFPGSKPRGQALREAANDAWRLALVCVLTLLVAGIIEGFVTPLRAPTAFPEELWFWLKIAIGALVFLAWFSWLYFGGRKAGAETV